MSENSIRVALWIYRGKNSQAPTDTKYQMKHFRNRASFDAWYDRNERRVYSYQIEGQEVVRNGN